MQEQSPYLPFNGPPDNFRLTAETPKLRAAVIILAVAAIYFTMTKIGLIVPLTTEQATLMWPLSSPTGIAVVAVVLMGPRIWPAIMLGALATYITAYMPVVTAAGIALGSTLEALCAVWLLHRLVGPIINLNRLKDTWGLFLLAGFLSPMIGASIGVTSLCLKGLEPWAEFGQRWLNWWLGGALDVYIVVPALLVWLQKNHYYEKTRSVLYESLIFAAALLAYSVGVMLHPVFLSTAKYLIFPFIIYAALRFGQRGTTLVTLAAFGIEVTALALNNQSVIRWELSETDLIGLNIFVAFVAATGMFLGSNMAERREAEESLRESRNKTQLIIDNALDAIISMDQRGLITEWSRQAETMFGWSRQEMMGRPMASAIIPPVYREAHRLGLDRFLKEGISKILNQRIELEAMSRGGSIFPIELSVTAQEIRGQYSFTAFIRDISINREAGNAKGVLAAIVESSGDAIISKTLDGIITSWNKGAERLFGYSAAEALNKDISLIIPADKREEESNISAQMREGKQIQRYETVRVGKSGHPIEVLLTESPVRDAAGRLIGVSKIIHDISELRAAEKKTRAVSKYLGDVLDHIPDPIFMKDKQHCWIGGNKAFWELMGGLPEKFIGRSDYDFLREEEAEVAWARDDRVFNSREVDISEEVFTDSKGERHILSIKATSFLNEENERFLVAVVRDVTYSRKMETKLVQYTKELEYTNRELDDFAYVASHDLKEPLRGLTILTSLLLEDYRGKLDSEVVQRLQRLEDLSARANQLVSDLLDFSRLGRVDVVLEKVEPDVVIADIRKILEIFLKEKNARLVTPHPMPGIMGDKVGLEEVLRNLIVNAAKYNDKDEKIIEVGVLENANAPHGPEKNVFYVKDNGIGIDPRYHQDIFRIFRRLPTSAKYDAGGTGVGLTFVKKIIERNNGHIWLESASGKGSTFYFTMGAKV